MMEEINKIRRLAMTAEGVATDEERDAMLRDMECDEMLRHVAELTAGAVKGFFCFREM